MAGGWKLKRLHKLIMTSTAYRQSSARDPRTARARSRESALLRGCRVRRLEAEALRDRMLAASGVLNRKMFGPPVPVKEDAVGQVVVGVDAPAGRRRAAAGARGVSPQHLRPGAPQPAAGHAARLRPAGDGNQLRAPHGRRPWPRSR